jgi:hypothetical protein
MIFTASNIFTMTDEERKQVDLITVFLALFYVWYWLTTPLSTSAPRHDLKFMGKIQR